MGSGTITTPGFNFLGDFVVIIASGDVPPPAPERAGPVQVPQTLSGTQFPLDARFNFDTGGSGLTRQSGAFLLCTVRGPYQGALILINDREAGNLTHSSIFPPSGDLNTELIRIDAGVLSDASGPNNRLSFKFVNVAFTITTLACFFQQEP